MKILIAADGSSYSRAAARYVAHHLASFKPPVEIHVLYVQPPIPYPGAAGVAGTSAVRDYQRDESVKALAAAESELRGAGVAFTSGWRVGHAADELAGFARDGAFDLIVTGSHGHGALASLAMGSVATKLVAVSSVPVLVITREAARQDPMTKSIPAAASVPSAAIP